MKVMLEPDLNVPAVESGSSYGFDESASVRPRASETILVVDDEPLVREVIAQILSRLGYHVLEACDGSEAQCLARQNNHIDLLLTDYQMPRVNGLELARWFQRQFAEGRVLIASGSLWEVADQIGEQERITVLPKPFDPVQLVRMVRRVLAGHTVEAN